MAEESRDDAPEVLRDADPIIQGVIDRVHAVVRSDLEKRRDSDLAEAGFLKKPILKLQWEFVLGILLKIVFLVIELAIDQVAKLSPDVVMVVVVRRRRELESRQASRHL